MGGLPARKLCHEVHSWGSGERNESGGGVARYRYQKAVSRA